MLLLRTHLAARSIPHIYRILKEAWMIKDSELDFLSVSFYEKLRFSLPTLNNIYIKETLLRSEELTLFFGKENFYSCNYF